jgi:hypothetical protein
MLNKIQKISRSNCGNVVNLTRDPEEVVYSFKVKVFQIIVGNSKTNKQTFNKRNKRVFQEAVVKCGKDVVKRNLFHTCP